MPSVR